MAITIVSIIIIVFFEIIYLLNIVRLGYDFWLAQADGVHHSRSGIYALGCIGRVHVGFYKNGRGREGQQNQPPY